MSLTKNTNYLLVICLACLILTSCDTGKKKLPIFGERDWTTKTVNGEQITDTIYHTIPGFKFVNQKGDTVTEKITEGKVYVADFFFTSCPTICPVMKKQMVKVYNEFKTNPDVLLISHTIDPEHDTPQVQKQFADDLDVSAAQWQFLTGPKEKIYEIGQQSYMSTAKADSTAEGGFIHSGAFILVDKEKHVRGMYDGTTEEGTQRLIADLKVLLDEYKSK